VNASAKNNVVKYSALIPTFMTSLPKCASDEFAIVTSGLSQQIKTGGGCDWKLNYYNLLFLKYPIENKLHKYLNGSKCIFVIHLK
jgi:hypothetical protein